MRWSAEWCTRRRLPPAMKGRRRCRVASKIRPSGPVLARQVERGEAGEGRVLAELAAEAAEPAPNRESQRSQPAGPLGGRLASLAQYEEVDLVAGIEQGVDLPADARIGRKGRVR